MKNINEENYLKWLAKLWLVSTLYKSGYDCKHYGESIFGGSVVCKLNTFLCFESNTIYGA